MLSRDDITAALTTSGAGARGWIDQIACEALADARVGPYGDPERLASGLRYFPCAVVELVERAVVRGDRLSYLWNPDQREWGLNCFLAVTMAHLEKLHVRTSTGDLLRLTGSLALPAKGSHVCRDIERQRFLPAWFIDAHHRARGASLRLVTSR